MDRVEDREIETQAERNTYRLTKRQSDKQKHIHVRTNRDIKTNRQSGRPTDRDTGRQKHIETD